MVSQAREHGALGRFFAQPSSFEQYVVASVVEGRYSRDGRDPNGK
jgi:hypothetical protein